MIVGDGSGRSGSDISIPDIFGYFVTPFTDLVIQVQLIVLYNQWVPEFLKIFFFHDWTRRGPVKTIFFHGWTRRGAVKTFFHGWTRRGPVKIFAFHGRIIVKVFKNNKFFDVFRWGGGGADCS